MYASHDPKWLVFLSRRFRNLAIPNLAAFFVGLQIIGFLFVSTDPAWFQRLALIPSAVLQGEVWRIVSFLAVPLTTSIIGLLFTLMFGYFILNLIESEWGEVKTTLYVFISVILTALFSLVFDYPVLNAAGLVSTLFLAAATLFPENTIQIYFVLPVKMKYLGWLAVAYLLFQLFVGSWMHRFFLVTIYLNYLLFFGPYLIYRVKQWQRRREFKSKWR